MNPARSTKTTATVLCVALNPAVDLTIEVAGLRLGEVNRAQRAQQDAGGKGINVASCLADYGVKVAVTGQLGRDNPALFEALFNDKGIADHCLYIDGSTRVNAKVVDAEKGETTDINLPGAQQTAAQIDTQIAGLQGVLDELAPSVRWVVLSGSLPPGWPDDTYATLIRHAHAIGARVMLDTSGPALSRALAASPEIIKPNRDELAEHLGRPLGTVTDIATAAQELLAAHSGLRLVAVSMGRDGAVFVSPDASFHAHPLDVAPISTVGAGDSMVGAMTLKLAEGASLEDMVKFGVAAGSAATINQGTKLCSRADTQKIYDYLRNL